MTPTIEPLIRARSKRTVKHTCPVVLSESPLDDTRVPPTLMAQYRLLLNCRSTKPATRALAPATREHSGS